MRSFSSLKRLSTLAILSAAVAGCGETRVVYEREPAYHDQAPAVYRQDQAAYAPAPVAPGGPAPVDQNNDNTVAAAPVEDYGADNTVNVQPALIDETPDDQDAQYFQQDLAPYGDWVDTTDYGRCWHPRNVAADWQPYTNGHWVYTDDAGWLWASAEPFGDITCHYGRWFQDPHAGWCWAAGTVWAPSWCDFREGGGVFAWAPLPPLRHGEVNVSADVVLNRVRPDDFVYVDERHLVDSDLSHQIHHGRENVTVINKTRNVTNYTVVNNRVVNRSVNVHNVERVTGKQVQHLKIATADKAGPTQVRGNEVAVFQKKDLPQKKDLKAVESRSTSAQQKAQRTQPQANRDQNRQTLESQQQPKHETAQDQARTASERQQAEQQQAAKAKQNADHAQAQERANAETHVNDEARTKAEADQRTQAHEKTDAEQRAASENRAKAEADERARTASGQIPSAEENQPVGNAARDKESQARAQAAEREQAAKQAAANQAKAPSEDRARAEQNAQAGNRAKVQAEEHARAQQDAKAPTENQAKVQADHHARAEQNAQADNRAKVQAEEHTRVQQDPKAQAENRAKAQADDHARAQQSAQAETRAKAEAEDHARNASEHVAPDDHPKTEDAHAADKPADKPAPKSEAKSDGHADGRDRQDQ